MLFVGSNRKQWLSLTSLAAMYAVCVRPFCSLPELRCRSGAEPAAAPAGSGFSASGAQRAVAGTSG